jgi:hypothetical protein
MDAENPWDEADGQELEAEIMRADHAFGVELRGTTPEESLEGSSLEDALIQEGSDARLIGETFEVLDEGVADTDGRLIAEGVLVSDDFPAPEESALSIRDEAPGATDHDDPDWTP